MSLPNIVLTNTTTVQRLDDSTPRAWVNQLTGVKCLIIPLADEPETLDAGVQSNTHSGYFPVDTNVLAGDKLIDNNSVNYSVTAIVIRHGSHKKALLSVESGTGGVFADS